MAIQGHPTAKARVSPGPVSAELSKAGSPGSFSSPMAQPSRIPEVVPLFQEPPSRAAASQAGAVLCALLGVEGRGGRVLVSVHLLTTPCLFCSLSRTVLSGGEAGKGCTDLPRWLISQELLLGSTGNRLWPPYAEKGFLALE